MERGILCLLALLLPLTAAGQSGAAAPYDAETAVGLSQAAVGRELADLELTAADGRTVRLSDFEGQPVLISLIFTSCYHVCPAITRHLGEAVKSARTVLGDDSFRVLTIGFDTANDTPDAMREFAARVKIDDSRWLFLSGDADTMRTLTDNIGFSYFPSPRGFDHVNQVTLVDRAGVIDTQVYGAGFELPWLVEPLKELVFDTPPGQRHLFSGLTDRVRLFCTVYDPTTGRYRFDYSLFVGIGVGVLVLLVFGGWFLLETHRARRGGS